MSFCVPNCTFLGNTYIVRRLEQLGMRLQCSSSSFNTNGEGREGGGGGGGGWGGQHIDVQI